jgi:site-specific DNA-methyltransferase (adenine-specific)
MRTEQIGSATLLLGDAFDILPALDAVDVIITDPPYGRQTHENARTAVNRRPSPLIDFDSIAEERFIELCAHAVTLAKRWVVMSCEWRYVASLERAGLPLVRFGIWHKLDSAPQFSGDRPAMGWEAVAILHRKGKKRWNGGGHHAVWVCNIEHGEHPTQKPLALVSDWVLKFTNPGETVLDPFMGSGTTGIACARLGCKFIGIEKRPDYFEMACRRIADAHRQADLFPVRHADPEPGYLL